MRSNRHEAKQLEGMLKEISAIQRMALSESGIDSYQTCNRSTASSLS